MVSHKILDFSFPSTKKKKSVNPGPEVLHCHPLLHLLSFKEGSEFIIYLSALITHLLNLLDGWHLIYLYLWVSLSLSFSSTPHQC